MDVQAEADRLLSLDDAGREREMLVIALQLANSARQDGERLRQLDEEFLDAITGNRAGNVGPSEGAESLLEHVDA